MGGVMPEKKYKDSIYGGVFKKKKGYKDAGINKKRKRTRSCN